MTKKPASPKSQSEQAEERRTRAKEARLEQAGTAVLEGKPGKAKKILAAEKKQESKKPSPKQATEILSEAHTIEMQLTAIEHKIDGIKEEYKELKAQRERLVGRLRMEVRDMGQGRLPFQAELPSGVKSHTLAEKTDEPIEAELSGKTLPGEIDVSEAPGKADSDAKKEPAPKKKAEGRAA
jgi:predicted  nucleic acid-binding Zn-ribbon protein